MSANGNLAGLDASGNLYSAASFGSLGWTLMSGKTIKTGGVGTGSLNDLFAADTSGNFVRVYALGYNNPGGFSYYVNNDRYISYGSNSTVSNVKARARVHR
jgi:hypothetical protein